MALETWHAVLRHYPHALPCLMGLQGISQAHLYSAFRSCDDIHSPAENRPRTDCDILRHFLPMGLPEYCFWTPQLRPKMHLELDAMLRPGANILNY